MPRLGSKFLTQNTQSREHLMCLPTLVKQPQSYQNSVKFVCHECKDVLLHATLFLGTYFAHVPVCI